MQTDYVITIARQFGAAGLPVAEELSRRLNIEYFNRVLVDRAAEELKIPAAKVLEEEELKDGRRDSIFEKLFPLGNGPRDLQDKIFAAQSHVIQSLAENRSCIIVGRCADYVLRKFDNTLNVYFYASLEARVRYCVDYLGMSEDEALKIIPKAEKARKNYHIHYTGYELDDPAHKDLLIDTGKFGVSGTADILEHIIKTKYC